MRTIQHGTVNEYVNFGCRCQPCRDAWAPYHRSYGKLWNARNLAKGLTANGGPRSQLYDRRALRALEEHGLEPDLRWMPRDRLFEAIQAVDPATAEYLRRLGRVA